MSKATKARAKTKRAGEKRARKATMKAQYQAWAAAGVTKGSKRGRQTKAKGKKLVRVRKGKSNKQAFPLHLWLTPGGTLKHGAPHRAFLELQKR